MNVVEFGPKLLKKKVKLFHPSIHPSIHWSNLAPDYDQGGGGERSGGSPEGEKGVSQQRDGGNARRLVCFRTESKVKLKRSK